MPNIAYAKPAYSAACALSELRFTTSASVHAWSFLSALSDDQRAVDSGV